MKISKEELGVILLQIALGEFIVFIVMLLLNCLIHEHINWIVWIGSMSFSISIPTFLIGFMLSDSDN